VIRKLAQGQTMTAQHTLDSIRVGYPAPPHIPKDRIVDLTFAMGNLPNNMVDPYEPCEWLAGPKIPRLLYNIPAQAGLGSVIGMGSGYWVVTHYDDIDRVYTDDAHFSNASAANFQRLIGESFRSIPLNVDPPEHKKYRMFLAPYFSPTRISRDLEPRIRGLAIEMIDTIAARGEVDIAWDFARIYPVRIFMELMGFPEEMFTQFLAWEWDILHSGNREKTQTAMRGILEFLRRFMTQKEKDPDESLTSSIVNGRIEGRLLTEEEKIGIVWFLWLGGLDTVAATISQMFRRMALQPDIQHQLRGRPELTNGAVEEFLRIQPIVSPSRDVTKDFEWHGVLIKEGDKVCCLTPSGNFDSARFVNPRIFDPTRTGNRHHTFVTGAHTCLGAHLARRELRILLDEWLARIPEFCVKPGADTTVFPGMLSIRHLPLVWDPSSLPLR
jgi:cytochrome P450